MARGLKSTLFVRGFAFGKRYALGVWTNTRNTDWRRLRLCNSLPTRQATNEREPNNARGSAKRQPGLRVARERELGARPAGLAFLQNLSVGHDGNWEATPARRLNCDYRNRSHNQSALGE